MNKAPTQEKTREEIEELKIDWHCDPCFDLENATGFEAHHDELLIYRLQQENQEYRRQIQRLNNLRTELKAFLDGEL